MPLKAKISHLYRFKDRVLTKPHTGSFYELYPRRRMLISINKRNTGETNTEFNMRHDWNSLLSDDPTMLFKYYSKEMFPPADALVSVCVFNDTALQTSTV